MALPETNTAAHIGPGEAWLWVGLLAAAVVIQSTALSFQKGVEVPLITAPRNTTEDDAGTADIDEGSRQFSIRGR
ncbi:hypothetical protein [uncultured Mycobacterium sp.]|uniref:hypothetical protein n=1 Tax=uncultured Mycobacterium sp. TaxID=171292 RepID=UPI0035C965A6